MAFIVARPHGRYEIRESVQTERGPRARSLANFAVLTGDVLRKAGARATRPFDVDAVVRAARRRRVPTRGLRSGAPARPERGERPPRIVTGLRRDRFVDASRRFAAELDRDGRPGRRMTVQDPGQALIELIGFAEAVNVHRPPRVGPAQPLEFPVMSRLAAKQHGGE